MRIGSKSDKGMQRPINEDSYNILFENGSPFAIVIADGMGGHNSGEIASKLAVDVVNQNFQNLDINFEDDDEVFSYIRKVMHIANNIIYTHSNESESNFGMGTTMILSLITDNKIFIGHVGDSRAYTIKNNNMKKITTDHSYIQELLENGTLTQKEAQNHPKKNLITRALGCFDLLEVDTYLCEFEKSDIFLFCTDGLTNMIPENEILRVIMKYEDPQEACDMLIKEANARGGDDNITVIILKN